MARTFEFVYILWGVQIEHYYYFILVLTLCDFWGQQGRRSVFNFGWDTCRLKSRKILVGMVDEWGREVSKFWGHSPSHRGPAQVNLGRGLGRELSLGEPLPRNIPWKIRKDAFLRYPKKQKSRAPLPPTSWTANRLCIVTPCSWLLPTSWRC